MLVSGGLDSAVALAEAARGAGGAGFRAGLVWEPAEMYWLERFLQTIDAPELVISSYRSATSTALTGA